MILTSARRTRDKRVPNKSVYIHSPTILDFLHLSSIPVAMQYLNTGRPSVRR